MPEPRALLVAPFLVPDMRNSRPRAVAEALGGLMPVDIVTTDWDHQSLSRRGSGGVQGEAGYAGGQVFYLPTPAYKHHVSPARFVSHGIFSLRAARWFVRNRSRYSVIYATLPLNLAAWRVLSHATPGQHRIVDVVDIWPDVLPFPDAVRRVASPAFRVWRRAFERACGQADTLLAVSDRFRAAALPHFPGESEHAARFYIGHHCLPSQPGNPTRGDDVLTIAYIGNIGHVYDLNSLVEAMAVTAAVRPVQLDIIGDGDRRDWLLGELRRRGVPHRFMGAIWDPRRLAEGLAGAHVGFNGYIHTTAAFSYKAATYMAAGLPILNSMTGDLRQLVMQRGIGFNYPAGDAAALARLLQDLRPDTVRAAGDAASAFFRDELELDGLVRRLREYLRGRLAEGPRLATAAGRS